MAAWIGAKEIAKVVGCSESKAYSIIRQLNEELRRNGYITISGKVSRRFFNEKFYGGTDGDYKP